MGDEATPAQANGGSEQASLSVDGLDQRTLYIQRCKEMGLNSNSLLKELFQATIQPEPRREEYDLHQNYIGDRGLIPTIAALKLDRHFKRLNLSDNGIRNAGCVELVDFLKAHKPLTSLDVSLNQISLEGGLALLDLLKDNQNLVSLNYNNNRIDVNTRLKLKAALEVNIAKQNE